jgi:hypothetical protein
VVTECGMHDMFVLATSFEQISTNFWVTTFKLVVGSFSNIVQ